MTMPMSSSVKKLTAFEQYTVRYRRLRRLCVFQVLAVVATGLYFYFSERFPVALYISPAIVAVALFGLAFVLVPHMMRGQRKHVLAHSLVLAAILILQYQLFNPSSASVFEATVVEIMVSVLLIGGTLFTYLRFKLLLIAHRVLQGPCHEGQRAC